VVDRAPCKAQHLDLIDLPIRVHPLAALSLEHKVHCHYTQLPRKSCNCTVTADSGRALQYAVISVKK